MLCDVFSTKCHHQKSAPGYSAAENVPTKSVSRYMPSFRYHKTNSLFGSVSRAAANGPNQPSWLVGLLFCCPNQLILIAYRVGVWDLQVAKLEVYRHQRPMRYYITA